MRSHLLPALLASLLIHAALVVVPGRPWRRAGVGRGVGVASPLRHGDTGTMVVRMRVNAVAQLTKPEAVQPTQPAPVQSEPPPSPPGNLPSPAAAPDTASDQAGSAASDDAAVDVRALYWPSSALDLVAQADASFQLYDPTLSSRLNVNGTTVLNVYINERGTVDQVEIEHSSVPDEVAEDLRKQFQAATFTPAMRHGQAVRSLQRIEVCVGVCAMSSEPVTP